jgi:zinc transport system substrate-binding protein
VRSAHLIKRSAHSLLGYLLATVAVGALWLSCAPEPPASQRPLVVVSVPPLMWFVEAVAGDAVDVVSLLPAGASPTSFEPRIATLRDLEAASLVVAVGHPSFPFERTWFGELLRDRGDLPVVRRATAQGAAASGPNDDPHWWLSPVEASGLIDPLTAELTNLLPEYAAVFSKNAAKAHVRIAKLDREIAAALSESAGRRFLVFHPAWGHFAQHYQLEQVAIEEDGKEPDAYRMALLIENARTAGFQHVIVQPQIDPAHAQSVAGSIGASIVTLDPLAHSWEDNLRAAAERLANGVLVP